MNVYLSDCVTSHEISEQHCAVQLGAPLPPIIAVGAHLKSTVAISVGDRVVISDPIGDLETPERFELFRRLITELQAFHQGRLDAVACDLHPDYLSTQVAETLGLPVIRVQHHYAHVLSCMAENHVKAPVLGISWDGTGYGTDGTIWGGEFLHVNESSFTRAAHFRTFPLPGGEKAVKEPRRSALGLLYALLGDCAFQMSDLAPLSAFSSVEQGVLKTMLAQHINTPVTSSAGRLFDAVAALVGLRQFTDFEGQAAMELERALDDFVTDEYYDFEIAAAGNGMVADWTMLAGGILDDLRNDVTPGLIAAKFHNTLAEIIVSMACLVRVERVVLTGGCFQNHYLLERAIHRLEREGFRPYWHHRIPATDAGIALGQIMAAARELRR
jgi:hydrogenase maturation protein HypF